MNPEHDFDEHQDPAASEGPRINGSAVRHDGGDPDVVPIAGLDDVAWRPSYDRESVDRYLAEVEVEKGRLLAEIRLAEEREAAAKERCGEASATERDALLGALLLAARAEIDRVDTEHRETVSAIYALAEEESAGIRDRAQADATAVRDVVASLTAITSAGESMREVVASLTAITSAGESTEGAGTESADDAADDPESEDPSHAG